MKTKFGDYEVEVSSVNLADGNELAPFVIQNMVKISLGDFDHLFKFEVGQLEKFQNIICKYTTKHTVDLDGNTIKKNLSLSDIKNSFTSFIIFFAEFLEYQFGFFSNSRKMTKMLAFGILENANKKSENLD